jgi:hypothetical protein
MAYYEIIKLPQYNGFFHGKNRYFTPKSENITHSLVFFILIFYFFNFTIL